MTFAVTFAVPGDEAGQRAADRHQVLVDVELVVAAVGFEAANAERRPGIAILSGLREDVVVERGMPWERIFLKIVRVADSGL